MARAVFQELLQDWRGKYAKVLSQLSGHLKAADETAARLRAIQGEAHREAISHSIAPLNLAPNGRGDLEFALENGRVQEFLKIAKDNGYEL